MNLTMRLLKDVSVLFFNVSILLVVIFHPTVAAVRRGEVHLHHNALRYDGVGHFAVQVIITVVTDPV